MENAPRFDMLSIVLDCGDVHGLADFYAALLGWTKRADDTEWIGVSAPGVLPFILFQHVEGYEPPVWPDEKDAPGQMMHMDFAVSDLELGIQHALDCGARLAPVQFTQHWTVMLDPAGHPFCLSERA